MSRLTTVGALAGALLLLPAAAWAHPALNPNAGPAGEAIESTLVVPHGCAPGGEMPDGDADPDTVSPTVLLSLQVRDGVTIEPGDVDGWETAVTDTEVTWTDAGGATIEVIQLPVTLEVDGDVGESLYVRAYQECENGDSFQWIGTPDDEARWPAVFVTVADEVGNEAPAADDHGDMDMGDGDDMATDDMATDDEATDHDGMDMGDEMDDGATATEDDVVADESTPDDDGADDGAVAEGEEAAMADDAEGADDGLPTGLVAAVFAGLAAAAAALVLRGRRTDG